MCVLACNYTIGITQTRCRDKPSCTHIQKKNTNSARLITYTRRPGFVTWSASSLPRVRAMDSPRDPVPVSMATLLLEALVGSRRNDPQSTIPCGPACLNGWPGAGCVNGKYEVVPEQQPSPPPFPPTLLRKILVPPFAVSGSPCIVPSECDDVIKRALVSRSRALPHREVTGGLRRPPLLKRGDAIHQ